jgi:hypothetical protein
MSYDTFVALSAASDRRYARARRDLLVLIHPKDAEKLGQGLEAMSQATNGDKPVEPGGIRIGDIKRAMGMR